MYAPTEAGPVRRPARKLRAFTRIEFAAGESAAVELTLDRCAFAYHDVKQPGWVVAAGTTRSRLAQTRRTSWTYRPSLSTGIRCHWI
ncbi:fibronectin type III-like domain-contianing protein [Nocardia neocaledoniensis]|uniref:fibronectin type III-like domain-contianing protein n=1 Tax=Nocardia neocaledoniensis TaxID=236511 RepID=UPI003CC7D8A6